MISEIPHLPNNPTLRGQAEVLRQIPYSQNGQELTLILPWAPRDSRENTRPAPLILFVQGSAWTTPNRGYEIPMLSHFAEEGYAVATVSHRSTEDGHLFPAFLTDVKCAIRFLRHNAGTYGIDPDHVTAFGTSSGGNTVCLLGLTGDDPAYRTEEYPDESDAVGYVVSCFAPTHLSALFEYLSQFPNVDPSTAAKYFGPDESGWPEAMARYSPALQVKQDAAYSPFLLLHGTADPLVPCSQMDLLYTALRDAHADVTAYYVDGAEHEGTFWSPGVRRVIRDAIKAHMPID